MSKLDHRTAVLGGIVGLTACAGIAVATTDDDRRPAGGHFEAPPAGARYVQPGPRVSSPGYRATHNGFVVTQVNVDPNGNNIVGDAANEPSMAIDPNNGVRMAIGWRQFDTIASSFRQAGYGYSVDAGRTWTFPGVIDAGIFRSDPVLDTDADGNFYYNSLTVVGNDFLCDVFISSDGGQTWGPGVFAHGGDKQWMVIDRTDGIGRGNIYAAWNVFFSVCEDNDFTMSYDGGGSYETCIAMPGSPRWGNMAVGPDGVVYVAGTGAEIARSSTLQDPTLAPAFDFALSVDLGGDTVFGEGPNPGGLLGQTWVDVDRSGGPLHNNVYLLSTMDPPGSDPAEVFFARSEDGGLTWSSPVRVNDIQSGWQWFGTMAVAPDGRIDVTWNDTSNGEGEFDSAVRYASSSDGGVTWTPSVELTPSFDPHLGWPQQNKIGDYCQLVSDLVGADLAFSATFNGEQDVYHVRIGDTDCNRNGIGDSDDIAQGTSEDLDGDGLPDDCQCLADLDGNGSVGFADLLSILGAWGPCTECPQDLDRNGVVDFADVLRALTAWGGCP